MRLLSIIFLCLTAVLSGRAQERVRNVRIKVTDSSLLEIRYDLINTRSGDSIYLEIHSRVRGALHILPEFVRGDIGTLITAGSNRRIVWNALANGYPLNEEIQAKVLVKTGVALLPPSAQAIPTEPAIVQKSAIIKKTVPSSPPEAAPTKPIQRDSVAIAKPKPPAPVPEPAVVQKPTPQPNKTGRSRPSVFAVDSTTSKALPPVVSAPQTESVVQSTQSSPSAVPMDTVTVKHYRNRYTGPAWALLSVVAPGIGNIFVQMPKPKVGLRPLLTVGCYGLLIYGFMERQKYQDTYAVYEQQKNVAAGDPFYQTANDHYHRYFMATRGALVVAAADVLLTFIRGVRNGQIQKEARRYRSFRLRPGFQAGQPTAVVRYSF